MKLRPIVVTGLSIMLGGCAAAGAATPTAHAPGPPGSSDGAGSWPMYALNPAHNAVVPGGTGQGRSWTFAVPGALGRGAHPPASEVPQWRDLVGFGVGAAVVSGTVYVGNDNGKVYALSSSTGRLKWSFDAHNEVMSTPLVVRTGETTLVIVGVGNSTFSYSQAVRFGVQGAQVTRGTGFSGIDALDAKTGRLAWALPTRGEQMPTPIFAGGLVVTAGGGGHVRAVDPATGRVRWTRAIGSFVSMSSLNLAGDTVVFGGTHPSRMYGINLATGALRWSYAPPGVFSSSMGDGTPAVLGNEVVTQIEVATAASGTAGSEELALDSATGTLRWARSLGTGPVPPRNKDANPVIVGDTVFTGSPVTSRVYALDLATGALKWSTALGAKIKTAPTLVGGSLLVPTASGAIALLDSSTGALRHSWNGGLGGYGPQNLVVTGNTAYIGTNFGWFQAVPLSRLVGTR